MQDYDSWLELPYWRMDDGGNSVCEEDICMEFKLTYSIRENSISYNGHISQTVEYVTGYGDVDCLDHEVDKHLEGVLNTDNLFSDKFKDRFNEKLQKINNNSFVELKGMNFLNIVLCFLRGVLYNKIVQHLCDGWIREGGYKKIDEIEKNGDIENIFNLCLYEIDFDGMIDEEFCNVISKGLEIKIVEIEFFDHYTIVSEVSRVSEV